MSELHYAELGLVIWLGRCRALVEDLLLNYLQNCFGELLSGRQRQWCHRQTLEKVTIQS